MRARTLAACLAAAAALAAPARAQEAAPPGPARGAARGLAPAPGPNPGPEVADPLSADTFGFTQGSDVAGPGTLSANAEYGGAYGVRAGRLRAHLLRGQVTAGLYAGAGLVKGVEINPTLVLGRSVDRDAGAPTALGQESLGQDPLGQGTRASNAAAGGAFEAKVKFLDLDRNGVGLTLAVEPSALRANGRALGALGGDATAYGLGARLLTDAILLPDRFFAAANIGYDGAWARSRGVPGLARASTLTLAASLTARVGPRLYAGAELRHLRAFDGAGLERYAGNALFLGPTFLYGISERLTLSGAYAHQVAGSGRGQPRDLDLENFTRHQAKLKLGASF